MTRRGAKADTRVTKYKSKCQEVVQGRQMMDEGEVRDMEVWGDL